MEALCSNYHYKLASCTKILKQIMEALCSSYLYKFDWEHLFFASCNANLAPCDFHLFPIFKTVLEKKTFLLNEKNKTAIYKFFHALDKRFFELEVLNLIKRCVNQCVCTNYVSVVIIQRNKLRQLLYIRSLLFALDKDATYINIGNFVFNYHP